MKRNLVLALVVLASTSVFATRARLDSLGENKDGSFFIEDSRNIFLNAAHVNHIKDSVILEWGDNQNYDTAADSDAEGGFFRSHGKFTYGVYFGRQADTIRDIRSVNSQVGGLTPLANENNLDIYFGGDAGGIEWGAALSYSSSDKESTTIGTTNVTDADQTALALRLGAVMGATEAWANISLANDAELNNGGTVEEFDGKLGLQLGVSHGFGHGYRAWAQYRANGADHIIGATTTESDFSEITVGLGKTTALNDNANMFSSIQYTNQKLELGPTNEQVSDALKAVVGLEADVKEWLTVRGSVSHILWGEEEPLTATTTNTTDESTSVAGGATIKLADFSIDGSVAKDGNNTVSRLGVIYNF